MLSKYSGLPLYFLAHDFAFSTPIAGVTGNKSTLVFSYISDGVSVFDGKEMILTYGDSISALLDAQGAWKQGYYLVIERDLCGNEERYIVYIDTEKPMLSATVQLGNGESNVIEFSQAYADEYENVMLYLGLGIEKILDNIDEYIMLTLDGRGLNKVSYVQGDEIPYLSYENGYYGKYVITVYDRSLNILTFTVTIAGAAPSVTHSSLTNETRLRLTIDVPDSNNAITNINIYKVSYTGERAKMSTDDDGTPITAETLVYILRTGGKYVVEIQDIFGRVVESDALFYMKGLPSGVLSGVRENGITKNTVTFQYANTNDILVYIYKDGDWVAADNRATITERSGYNYATIEATEENSYQYKIFLYASSDMNLFVEYIFEIDSVPPTVEIMTDEGEIASGTVTRLPFRVTWTEFGITAYYYNRNSTLGELSKARYTKDYIITTAGTFVFEVYDEAGNSITFEVTVDNSVSYTLEGDYSILEDGSYISKKSLTLTVTERTALWQCDSSNGISPMNGQVLTTDGTYSYVIQDMYGNELKITLIIDNLPPVPVIKTEDEDALDMNSSTNQAFTVSCEEANVSISYSTDGRSYSAYDGKLLDEELVYYFRLTDRMNNMVSFKIEIDRTVKYSLNGTYLEIEGGVTARSLTLTIGEDYKTFTAKSNNGVTVELGKRITEEGTYSIEITDLTGNTVYFIIVIDLTPPTPIIETLEGDLIEPNGSTNQAFKVYCDEPGISLYWSKRDGGYTFYEGDTFSEIGKYYFRLMDALGNELIFTVEIDGDVKFSIDGKYTLDDEGRYVSNTWLAVNVEEECTRFDVQTDSGRIFGAGERVTLEGVYTVTIYDTANNAVEIVLVIDKTPATPVIQTADGQEVEANGITNESFIVSCLETGATIEYSQNNKSFSKYDGSAIAEARIWYFKLTDLAGNIYDFTVELDSGVEFMVNGTYKIDGLGQYVSKNALSITLEENVVVFEVTSNNGITFTAGERIEIEGIYRVFIKDSANNSIEIVLVIDKSAPEPIIITTDDETLSMNGKTNQNFKIDCNESDVTIMWGEKSGEYAAYDGREFTAAKKYYFKLTDFIGNEITFTVEIERSVDYTIKGTYKEYSGYGYATATGVALIIDEEYSSFEVTSNNDIDIVLGERITAEGIYNVVIVDMVGNRVEFVIEVDYTAPVITLSGVDPGGITGDNVVVKVNDFETAYYTVSGVEGNISITDEIGLSDANKYTVIAVDRAGNRTTVTFTIDKSVDVDVFPEIISGQITTSAINVKVNERMNEIILMKGNQLVSFNGGTIAEAGVYNLKITDMYGNTVSYSWTIVPETAKAYDFNFPSDYRVSVSRDGAIVSDAVIGNTVVLSESGVYQVVFDNGTTKYSVKLTVDAVAPTVEITQEKTQVIISNPSKENVTLTLTKDGETVNYELGDVITATGDYTLTVTDAYGNMTVYTFSLHYINTFGIVVIAIACVIVVTIIIAAIVMRRKQGVR